MVRFVFRVLASVALAVAVILAVLDATRSVAMSKLVLTPLGESWSAVSPDTLDQARAAVESRWPFLWDTVAVWLLAMPGVAVFALLAFLLYAVGHRPERRRHFAAE
jgi:CubicO group peptidase (beta-lactamase class C family)